VNAPLRSSCIAVHTNCPGAFGCGKHQPHATGVEEGEVWSGVEEEGQPEHVAIEGQCRADIAHRDRDLADLGELRVRVHSFVHL